MRPCIGIPGHLPPLATWKDMKDGSLTLDDVVGLHEVMDQVMKDIKERAAQ